MFNPSRPSSKRRNQLNLKVIAISYLEGHTVIEKTFTIPHQMHLLMDPVI